MTVGARNDVGCEGGRTEKVQRRRGVRMAVGRKFPGNIPHEKKALSERQRVQGSDGQI